MTGILNTETQSCTKLRKGSAIPRKVGPKPCEGLRDLAKLCRRFAKPCIRIALTLRTVCSGPCHCCAHDLRILAIARRHRRRVKTTVAGLVLSQRAI
jgi:hypothetical protein